LIGEGTDARQTIIRTTRHRGTSQDEGEGEDKTDGPHLTVSGFGAGGPRRFVGNLITTGCFRISAPKRKMVSSPPAIVSSSRARRNNGRENPMISI
jgi:hypothetical protein